MPPFSYLALLKAEANNNEQPLAFLTLAKTTAQQLINKQLEILGPIAAPMERKGGFYRAQLLLQASTRSALHKVLTELIPLLDKEKLGKKIRWSLDVDPLEML